MPAACRAASAAHMRRGVERQPRLSSHPCHARRGAPCAPVGALAALHQPARRGAMHPGHCVGRQPACLSTEQERMLRTLAQHQLASNQALSPLHSRPRAPAAALLNAQAQEPPLVVAALCSAACEQRSARPTRGTPGRLWDEVRRASASRIGGHVSRRRERAAQRGSVAHAFRNVFCVSPWPFSSREFCVKFFFLFIAVIACAEHAPGNMLARCRMSRSTNE